MKAMLTMTLVAVMACGCSTIQRGAQIYDEAREAREAQQQAEQAERDRIEREQAEAEAARVAAIMAIPRYDWRKRPDPLQAVGAPPHLRPGADYRLWWNGPKTAGEGAWRFAYRGGGQGLYKRHEYTEAGERHGTSDIWIVPGVKAAQVYQAGEQRDGQWVRFFTWPRGVGSHAQKPIDGNNPAIDHPDHYEGGRLKLRSARATREDAEFVIVGHGGAVLARKVIYHPEVRQE